jgi:hypothetical protein
MSVVEEIQAAIDKLTKLKAESTPKPWEDSEDDLTGDVDLWHDQEQRLHIATVGVAGMPRVEADAELIAVLHRTLDAQLAILTNARDWWNAWPKGDIDADVVVALARAINGEVQW